MGSKKEKLAALIAGDEIIEPIGKHINKFIRWINPRVHFVKFEDLVGAAGGGNDRKQRSSIRRLYEYLDIEIDNDLVEYIATNSRSTNTLTYRTGRIANWKGEFDEELKALFKKIDGNLLIDMGYENNLSW